MTAAIETIWGVFQANGGLFGEISYIVGKITGRSHCSLCDITHGRTSEKAAMVACREASEAPLLLVHLNEQSEALAAFTSGLTPCVVAESASNGFAMLLDADALEECAGEVDRFEAALEEAKAAL